MSETEYRAECKSVENYLLEMQASLSSCELMLGWRR